ncbi:hypothetical protein, partial [Thioclava sp. F34-6]|uniref:hypothetical protein n=1 Tax=Thioclava sp. F34-6 TaxID=1973003 RepID=UPI00197F7210
GRHQPVTLSKAGKLCLRAVELWGADQHQPGSGRGWMKVQWQVRPNLLKAKSPQDIAVKHHVDQLEPIGNSPQMRRTD